MDISKDLSSMLAIGAAFTALLVAIVAAVSYLGYRSDVMGGGMKQLFLVLVFVLFVAAAVAVTFIAFPDLAKNLYLQIS
ncbi:MAG: hypothetical protein ABSD80_15440, partial [Caulobacteraceae bacterium]